MTNLIGPVEPWLGLVGAFGVGLALLVWYAVQYADDRIRAAATAAGGLLLLVAVGTAVSRAGTLASTLASAGFTEQGGRRVWDILLALGGAGIGIAAVLSAHARAEADAPGSADPVEAPDAEVGNRVVDVTPRGWAAAGPWVDVAAVVLALALPHLGGSGIFGPVGFGNRGGVTASVVIYHLLAGFVLGGALLAVLRPAEETDVRAVLAAFVLVAAGTAALTALPDTFANEFWTAFCIGLAAGLFVVAAPRLAAQAVLVDRRVLVAGVCAALALVVLRGIASGRVNAEQAARYRRGSVDIGNLVPTPVYPSYTTFPTP